MPQREPPKMPATTDAIEAIRKNFLIVEVFFENKAKVKIREAIIEKMLAAPFHVRKPATRTISKNEKNIFLFFSSFDSSAKHAIALTILIPKTATIINEPSNTDSINNSV